MIFHKPILFGRIEILPCSLTVDVLERIERRIKEEGRKNGAVFFLKKVDRNKDLLKVTLIYDWTALCDYGNGELYRNKIKEVLNSLNT